MKHIRALLAFIFLLALALAGCGGGGGGGGPVDVSITISPTQVKALAPGDSQTFTATVTGTTNTAVTWKIQEGSAGGSVVSTSDNTATYTAPQATGAFHVVVTSQADPTKSAIAAIQVGPPPPPWQQSAGLAACRPQEDEDNGEAMPIAVTSIYQEDNT